MKRVILLLSLSLTFQWVSFGQSEDADRAENLARLSIESERKADFERSYVSAEEALALFDKLGKTDRALDQYLQITELLIIKGQYDEAMALAQTGAEKSEALDLEDYQDKFNHQIGRIKLLLSKPYDAIGYFEKSYNYRSDKYGDRDVRFAEALNGMGRAKLAVGEFRAALPFLKQGLEITESLGESAKKEELELLFSMSLFYQQVALYNNLLEIDEKALEISLDIYGEGHPLTAMSYFKIAASYVSLQQASISEQHNLKSIQVRERLFGKDHPQLASNYTIMASNFYNQQMIEKCLESAQEAYRIAKLNFGEEHAETLWAMTYVIKALNELGRAKEGLQMAERVLKIRKKMLHEDHEFVARAYIGVAGSYNFLNDHENAKKNYLKAIEIRKKTNTHMSRMPTAYMQLTQYDLGLGLLKESVEHANNSMITNNPLVSKLGMTDWPVVEGYENFRNYYWAGAFKIYGLYSLAEQYKDSSEFFYKAALEGAHFLDSLVRYEIKRVTYSDDKFLSSANSHRAMELGFWAAYFLHQKTKDPFYQNEMLYFNERSKANMLLIKSQRRNAKSFAGVPDDIIEDRQNLLKKIETIKSEYLALLANEFAESQQIYEVRNAIYEEESKLVELNKTIKGSYPRYHTLIHETTPVTLDSVQLFLSKKKKKSAIVEYLVTTGNVYFTLILQDSSRGFNVRYNYNKTSMQKMVEDFRQSVMDINDTTLTKHSNHLHQLLIDSIRPVLDQEEIESLTVIPDGALFYLPFEILSSGADDYLMESFDISYANSITLLMREKNVNRSSNVISFAPEFTESLVASNDVVRGELAKLPGAQDEVNALSEILDNDPFLKHEATETNFKNNATKYGIIHLATHAIVDEESPESAKLIFNVENDTINDGNLYPHEIYNLDLKAQLVTLSACNTGFGKIKKGEGVMSLSRAFAYAGVPATVVSLWPASDQSTPELMKHFYENLKLGQKKDVALNNARKQYLSTAKGKARHPFYWGGFVLIGDNNPIQTDTSNRKMWVLMLGILIVAALAIIIKRRRGKSDIPSLPTT